MGTFGSPDGFQIVVLPNRPLGLFGFFQILLSGRPVGDGSTTAFYPHYCVLKELAGLVESGEPQERQHVIFGDTFDHLRIDVEVTDREIVFGIDPYRDEPDWQDAHVGKEEFLTVWAQAAACIEAILAKPKD